MGIAKETKDYIDSQIDYYINEAAAYRQIAEAYVPEIEAVPDTAFGIIAGCVYSAFLQVFQSQQKSPSLEEIKEFNKILKERAPLIKKALIEEEEEPKKEKISSGLQNKA